MGDDVGLSSLDHDFQSLLHQNHPNEQHLCIWENLPQIFTQMKMNLHRDMSISVRVSLHKKNKFVVKTTKHIFLLKPEIYTFPSKLKKKKVIFRQNRKKKTFSPNPQKHAFFQNCKNSLFHQNCKTSFSTKIVKKNFHNRKNEIPR